MWNPFVEGETYYEAIFSDADESLFSKPCHFAGIKVCQGYQFFDFEKVSPAPGSASSQGRVGNMDFSWIGYNPTCYSMHTRAGINHTIQARKFDDQRNRPRPPHVASSQEEEEFEDEEDYDEESEDETPRFVSIGGKCEGLLPDLSEIELNVFGQLSEPQIESMWDKAESIVHFDVAATTIPYERIITLIPDFENLIIVDIRCAFESPFAVDLSDMPFALKAICISGCELINDLCHLDHVNQIDLWGCVLPTHWDWLPERVNCLLLDCCDLSELDDTLPLPLPLTRHICFCRCKLKSLALFDQFPADEEFHLSLTYNELSAEEIQRFQESHPKAVLDVRGNPLSAGEFEAVMLRNYQEKSGLHNGWFDDPEPEK